MNILRIGWCGRARGQALTETLVAAMVLVPLLLLVVWLGKVMSVRQSTIAASRILAFECAARPDDCARATAHPELVEELRRRAFSRVDAPILTAERIGDDPVAAERNPLWVNRRNRPLLEKFSDIGARIDIESFDAGLSLATSRGGGGVPNVVQLLSNLAGPGRFGLGIGQGLVSANVQVNLSAQQGATSFLTQLDSIALRVQGRTAILTDAWNATGPYGADARTVQSRVGQGKALLPAYEATLDARYLPTRGFMGLMGAIGLEPSAGAFRYHDADVDLVPPDRRDASLQPGGGLGTSGVAGGLVNPSAAGAP